MCYQPKQGAVEPRIVASRNYLDSADEMPDYFGEKMFTMLYYLHYI